MTIEALAYVYPWTKAFHVISVIAWMAGIFYLPRLFVYHCDLARGSVESERFKVMERRLLKQIMLPAMLATWVLGVLLVLTPGVVDWSGFNWWHEVRSRAADDRLPGCGRQVAPAVPGGPQREAAPVLSLCQRGADGADGGGGHHGDREAGVLLRIA